MKKIILLLVLFMVSCTTDEVIQTPTKNEPTCYQILSRGYDNKGDFIIIKISNFNNRRYKVENYQDWLNKTKLCEPITLTQEHL
jgi:hypothetical protein